MEDIEDIIDQELEQKSIEKIPTLSAEISDSQDEPPKKSKKVRSEAQIAAFEKARLKRAENYEKRKLLKEQEKQEKKEIKTKIKEKVNNLSTEEIKEEIQKPIKKPVPNLPPQHSYGHYNYQQPQTPIINNYYYNTPPPQEPVKKGRKKKVVYVSDSDEEIEPPKLVLKQPAPAPAPIPKPQPAPAPQPRVIKKPSLKYNFVN